MPHSRAVNAEHYIPQVCLRRTNEEPLLAIPLSEVRVRGLVLDNVPDTLTNEAGATSYEDSYRHYRRSYLVGRRVRKVIDEGEREKEGEEEWKCITEIYYGLWALLEHDSSQRRSAVEEREGRARRACIKRM